MLKTMLIIAVIWFIAGQILARTLGMKVEEFFGEGWDAFLPTLIYNIALSILVYLLPIILASTSLFIWLYYNHRWMIKYIVFAIAFFIILKMLLKWLYKTVFRKMLMTPKRNAASIKEYKVWLEHEKKQGYHIYRPTPYTEYDFICEYIGKKVVDDTLSNIYRIFRDTYQEKKVEYVNVALQKATKTIPHVVGYEYITDITSIIPYKNNVLPKGHTLNKTERLIFFAHYDKLPNADHVILDYAYGEESCNKYDTDHPIVAVFYDNGKMDLVSTHEWS